MRGGEHKGVFQAEHQMAVKPLHPCQPETGTSKVLGQGHPETRMSSSADPWSATNRLSREGNENGTKLTYRHSSKEREYNRRLMIILAQQIFRRHNGTGCCPSNLRHGFQGSSRKVEPLEGRRDNGSVNGLNKPRPRFSRWHMNASHTNG